MKKVLEHLQSKRKTYALILAAVLFLYLLNQFFGAVKSYDRLIYHNLNNISFACEQLAQDTRSDYDYHEVFQRFYSAVFPCVQSQDEISNWSQAYHGYRLTGMKSFANHALIETDPEKQQRNIAAVSQAVPQLLFVDGIDYGYSFFHGAGGMREQVQAVDDMFREVLELQIGSED